MHATYRSAILRDELLVLMEELLKSQKILLTLADKHSAVVVPNYTNGVAAQPNAYGHYLLGHAAGFERDAQKYVKPTNASIGRPWAPPFLTEPVGPSIDNAWLLTLAIPKL